MTKHLQSEKSNFKNKIIIFLILLGFIGNKFDGFAQASNSSFYKTETIKNNPNAKKLLAPCDVSQQLEDTPIPFSIVPIAPGTDTYQTFTPLCTGNITGIQLKTYSAVALIGSSIALQIFDSNGALVATALPTLTGLVPAQAVYDFSIAPNEGAVVSGQTYYFKFSIVDGLSLITVINLVGSSESAYSGGGVSQGGGSVSTTNDAKFLITMAEGELPVTLISFSGKKTGENENTLTWKTSSEKNFSHFEIERSENAKKFEKIGELNGSNSENYQFVDNPANGVNYYRLKMIDLDGTSTLSKIIYVNEDLTGLELVGQFYPNPSLGTSTIDISAKENENWQISTYDLSGKLIHSETKFLQKGTNKISIEKLQNGVNFVKFESGPKSEIRKVIQQ